MQIWLGDVPGAIFDQGGMNTLIEQENFSLRLQEALTASGIPLSATKLSQIYNRNSPDRITVGGARKWLKSEAIPRQQRMVILAELTGTNATWLRYGTGPRNYSGTKRADANLDDLFMPSELALVPRLNIPILAEFVALLLADQAAKERARVR